MLARDHPKSHGMTTVFKGYGFFYSEFDVNDPIQFFLRYSVCAKGFERLLFLSLCNGLTSFCQLSLFRADELMQGLKNLKWF